MPLYEYQCQQCGRHVEKIQKFSDAPLTVCPHCAGVLERTLTAPAIQFKGSGWYKDLYSSAKPAKAAAEGTASKGEAATGSSGGGEPSNASAAAAPASTPTPTPSGSTSGNS